METNNLKKPPRIQLTVIHENNDIRYFKRCKIILDKSEEELIIVPREKDAPKINAKFDRNFIRHKNILCIDKCASDNDKYFLILPLEETCKHIIDSVEETKQTAVENMQIIESDEIFRANFLIPILKECVRDSVLDEQLKQTLSELLEFYKDKYGIENQTNGSQIDSDPVSSTSSSKCLNVTNNGIVDRNESKKNGKRKINFDENNEEYCSEPSQKQSCKENEHQLGTIIYAPNFKVINYVRRGIAKSRLFIFSTGDRSHCFEYYHNSSRNYYACYGCEKQRIKTWAGVEKDSNGVEYVKSCRTDHICNPCKYQPENYKSDLIIKKPNYDFIEEKYGDKMKKFLLLFTSLDKKNFYKLTYFHRIKCYLCTKCDYPGLNGCRKYINAHVNHDKNGNEFVYVRNLKHICSKMEYLETEEATVTKSKSLTTRENQMAKKFKRQKAIIKKLRSHPYPKLQHPRPTPTPQIFDESKIIRKPNYRLFQREVQGKMLQKLAIFYHRDNSMCYEYTWSKDGQKYICYPCKNRFGKHVYAKIIQSNDGDEFVEMGNFSHKCGLRKFVM